MNTNSCNINLQTRIDAHKYLIQSIISILSIRSLCIDSLTVSAICSSKMCMNKYICTVHIYIIYNSSYLIICHISIYLCITALVYLCSCRINMHIYISTFTAYLSNILKRCQYKALGHLMCWLLPALSMASPTLLHLFWFLLCCSLALQGRQVCSYSKKWPKAIGKVKGDAKEAMNEDLFDLMCKCHVGLQHLEGSHDWLLRIQNSCNEHQAKNLQMPSI